MAVTLDPDTDTIPTLIEYGKTVGADPKKWEFARLEGDALPTLLSRVEMEVDRAGKILTHNLRLLVLDKTGRLIHRERDNRWSQDKIVEVLESIPKG